MTCYIQMQLLLFHLMLQVSCLEVVESNATNNKQQSKSGHMRSAPAKLEAMEISAGRTGFKFQAVQGLQKMAKGVRGAQCTLKHLEYNYALAGPRGACSRSAALPSNTHHPTSTLITPTSQPTSQPTTQPRSPPWATPPRGQPLQVQTSLPSS